MRDREPTIDEVKESLRDQLLPLISEQVLTDIILRFLNGPNLPKQRQILATKTRKPSCAARLFLQKRAGIDELIEHRPRELQRLRFEVWLEGIKPLLTSLRKDRGRPRRRPKTEKERAARKRSAKDRYEWKRTGPRQHSISIQEQFGAGAAEGLPDLIQWADPLRPLATGLDELFRGGEVSMATGTTSLQSLFDLSRKAFPRKLPHRREGRAILYGLPALLVIMRSLLKTKKWLANPVTRKSVLNGIVRRADDVARPEIAAEVRATVGRYL